MIQMIFVLYSKIKLFRIKLLNNFINDDYNYEDVLLNLLEEYNFKK